MAATPNVRHYWIQLENWDWNPTPNYIDRMTGADPNPTKLKFKGALVYRRYREPDSAHPAWTVRDDRKVNPWDLNEPAPPAIGDPDYDAKYQGTIPGPVIECEIGESVIVHFRNMDHRKLDSGDLFGEQRATLDKGNLIHSLHAHGFVYAPEYDGAYPLSPEDHTQPVGSEHQIWEAIGVTNGYKMGDRVPSGATFDYHWQTVGWPTTAGVWLYHDHSVLDTRNVKLGAIGLIVIHNPADANNDFFIDWDHNPTAAAALLPGGKPNADVFRDVSGKARYYKPPEKAQYLLLFHSLNGFSGALGKVIDQELFFGDPKGTYNAPATGVAINGRKYLGSTPTLMGGVRTKMRFGLVAMDPLAFHTFHLHGHRWIVPGPDGATAPVIQNSAQVKPVSQFEDTRIFGTANSFSFTLQEGNGSFMGPPLTNQGQHAIGEWHMHCHVLEHMDNGMMGSLLIIDDNEPTTHALPSGDPNLLKLIYPRTAKGRKP